MNFPYTFKCQKPDKTIVELPSLPDHFHPDTTYIISRSTSALHDDKEYSFDFALTLSPVNFQIDTDDIIGHTEARIICAMDLPHDAIALTDSAPMEIPISVNDTPVDIASLFDSVHAELFAEFLERTMLDTDIRSKLFAPQSLN